MKNISFALRISFIFLFCIVFNNICMEIDVALNPKQYYKDCKHINDFYDQKFTTLISHKITEDNASDKITKMEQKLCKHGKSIEKKKNTFLNNIKKKYAITKDRWNFFERITNGINVLVVSNMHLTFKNVTHDPEIPQWFMAMLKKHLIGVGFNPQRTHIYKSETTDLLVNRVDLTWSYEGATGDITVTFKVPGVIRIKCDYFLDINKLDVQEGKCMFIAQNMKDSGINILDTMRSFGVKIEEADIDQFCKLHSLERLFAGVFESAYGAHCIKLFFGNMILHASSLDTHKQFCKIDFCWRALEWLKKYYTINYHTIPLLLAVKNYLGVAECNNLLDKGMVVTKSIIDEVKDDQNCKQILQQAYDEQQCCVCFEHPEDMRDIPCIHEHINNFICRQCYNQLSYNDLGQRKCPLCSYSCFSYNKVSYQ